jgi:hypothetical protein
MLAMDGRAGRLGEQSIARHDDFLRHARPTGQPQHGAPVPLVHHRLRAGHRSVLAVVEDGQPEQRAIFRGAPQDLVVLHTPSVIGHRDNPRLRHRPDGRELLAEGAGGDRAGGENVDYPDLRRPLFHPRNDARVIGHRVGIGHGHHRGEAARRRRFRPGLDGFLRTLTRFPQVHMDVDEPRAHDKPAGIDVRRAGGGPLREFSVGDEHIALFVAARCGIDDAAAADVDRVAHASSLGATEPQR